MIQNKLERLRQDYNGRGLSQAQLADRIGVSRSYISKIESGSRTPSAEIIFSLADFFGCSVEAIFQGRGKLKR